MSESYYEQKTIVVHGVDEFDKKCNELLNTEGWEPGETQVLNVYGSDVPLFIKTFTRTIP